MEQSDTDLNNDPRWAEGLRLLQQLHDYNRLVLPFRRTQFQNIILFDRLRGHNAENAQTP